MTYDKDKTNDPVCGLRGDPAWRFGSGAVSVCDPKGDGSLRGYCHL